MLHNHSNSLQEGTGKINIQDHFRIIAITLYLVDIIVLRMCAVSNFMSQDGRSLSLTILYSENDITEYTKIQKLKIIIECLKLVATVELFRVI